MFDVFRKLRAQFNQQGTTGFAEEDSFRVDGWASGADDWFGEVLVRFCGKGLGKDCGAGIDAAAFFRCRGAGSTAAGVHGGNGGGIGFTGAFGDARSDGIVCGDRKASSSYWGG